MFGHGFNQCRGALNQARVEETPVCASKLLEVRKVGNESGQSSLNSSRGETLQSLMEQHPDQLESYMEQFVLQKEVKNKRFAADQAERQDEPEDQPVRTGRYHTV